MCHEVVRGQQALLGKEHNPPLQPGSAFKQILPQPPDPQSRMLVGTPKTTRQRSQRLRDLFPLGGAQFRGMLPQTRMECNSHSLPVKGLDWPAFRAARTSAFTAL